MGKQEKVRRYFTKEDIEKSDMREEFKADAIRYLHHKIKNYDDAIIIGVEDNDLAQDYYFIIADFYTGDIFFELMNYKEFTDSIE